MNHFDEEEEPEMNVTAFAYIGTKPCGGCERRAAALNRWMVFTR